VGTHSITLGLSIALAAPLAAACYNPAVTIYQRAALEQELTRTAIWRVVEQLAIHKVVLEGEWRVKVLAPNPKDESWIKGALEFRLSQLGVKMSGAESPDAGIVVAAVVYAGIDVDNFYVGFRIPGGSGQALAFYQSITERGRAKIFLSFQDSEGTSIGTTEPLRRDAHYTSLYVLTLFGPIALTDLEIDTATRFRELGRDTLHQAGETANEWIQPIKNEDSEDDR
jgi:hypothetical protein